MKYVVCCVAALLVNAAAFGENASPVPMLNGKIIVAQSRCAICADQRTDCVMRCNGAGACIQGCDDDYQLCTERACRDQR
jgi:hypothetical protein